MRTNKFSGQRAPWIPSLLLDSIPLESLTPCVALFCVGCARLADQVLHEVDGQRFLTETVLAQEVFGPSALLVNVKDEDELLAVARSLKGQLSAAMQLDERDMPLAHRLLPILERRTGRIVVNAFAHPQEVSFATLHGGPFPATSDSRFTWVGMTSIERFLRPASYRLSPWPPSR